MDPRELQKFHRKYQQKFEVVISTNPGPATPVKPPIARGLITTPAGKSASDCLQHVEAISRSTMAKNSATTRDGRDKLTSIYNKMRKGKKDPVPREGRKLRPYDADGKGDERFEAAYKLMFDEGYTASKAAKQIVGTSQQNAFRIALCKCVGICICLFSFSLFEKKSCLIMPSDNNYFWLVLFMDVLTREQLETIKRILVIQWKTVKFWQKEKGNDDWTR